MEKQKEEAYYFYPPPSLPVKQIMIKEGDQGEGPSKQKSLLKALEGHALGMRINQRQNEYKENCLLALT